MLKLTIEGQEYLVRGEIEVTTPGLDEVFTKILKVSQEQASSQD